MLADVKKGYLINIIAAENTGTALSLDYCNQWGSSWESIVDCGQVYRCRVNGVRISKLGKDWLKDYDPKLDLDKILPHNIEVFEKEGHLSFEMVWRPVVALIALTAAWWSFEMLWQIITKSIANGGG